MIARAIRQLDTTGGEDIQQVVYYQKGVGSSLDVIERIPSVSAMLAKTKNGDKSYLEGAFGEGLEDNVRAAYGFIAHNFDPKPDSKGRFDEIYLFGFSRGAYTARSIGGLISQFGVLNKRGMDGIANVFAAYRAGAFLDKPPVTLTQQQKKDADELKKRLQPATPRIRCIGVWDTVGSLGIPDIFFLGIKVPLDTLFGDPNKYYQFHNTNLHPNVQYGFHAYVPERFS